jgi:hypothetical protein
MAIDEQRVRQSLHARLAATVGDDEAALLMDYLPPVGWSDVATRRDLDVLRTELQSEMHGIRSDLHAEIADLKSTLLMWLVPTVIGSIGLSVTLSRVL